MIWTIQSEKRTKFTFLDATISKTFGNMQFFSVDVKKFVVSLFYPEESLSGHVFLVWFLYKSFLNFGGIYVFIILIVMVLQVCTYVRTSDCKF